MKNILNLNHHQKSIFSTFGGVKGKIYRTLGPLSSHVYLFSMLKMFLKSMSKYCKLFDSERIAESTKF